MSALLKLRQDQIKKQVIYDIVAMMEKNGITYEEIRQCKSPSTRKELATIKRDMRYRKERIDALALAREVKRKKISAARREKSKLKREKENEAKLEEKTLAETGA